MARWGRVTLLEALSKYRATDVKDAEHVCERVVPQFQHQNASVVMAALKVVMLNLNIVGVEMQRSLIKKMGPPLGMSILIFCIDYSNYDLLST
jgi:vesicle coat complex subunit